MEILNLKLDDGSDIGVGIPDVVSFKLLYKDVAVIMFKHCVEPPMYTYARFKISDQEENTLVLIKDIEPFTRI